MIGLRRIVFSVSCSAFLFTGCGVKNVIDQPLAGEANPNDPVAAALYAEARAADAAGQSSKAIRLYERLANKYPFAENASEARFRQAELLEAQEDLLAAFDAYQSVIRNYQLSRLYTAARTRQEVVAHQAADGLIRESFLGLKSRLDNKKIADMLGKVRENAPESASAPKAQFRIGEVLAARKKDAEAIAAFQRVVDDYPKSSYAPEAFFRVGDILLTSSDRGNQNQANLDQARNTFLDLIQTYPGSPRATDARQKIAEIANRDVQRSFDIAAFYDKKGQTTSAAFYYQEVLSKAKSGDLHDRARRRLQELNAPTS